MMLFTFFLFSSTMSIFHVLFLLSLLLSRAETATAEGNVTLPLGDFNVIVVTDVHSWVGGHGFKEPHLNADYGHVLSFYQRFKEYCDSHDKNVWFVMNGDWIDGTALAMNGDPSHLIPLLEKMPWDLVNTGNHELYLNSVIDYMTQPAGYVDWWGSRLLTSNIVHGSASQLEESVPIGNLYRVLHGRNGQNVLAFGFLYDMTDHGNHVVVKSVETVVEEEWFTAALVEQEGIYDAILVLAHMGSDDVLVEVILNKIRSVVGDDVPVQFITGHTHRRLYIELDSASTAMEAGRFLDTVGFVSFPSKSTLQQRQQQHQSPSSTTAAITANSRNESNANLTDDKSSTNESEYISNTANPEPVSLFRYEFIDAGIDSLEHVLGAETLYTEDGVDLSKFIFKTQEELGLHRVVGCLAEAGYYLEDRSLFDSDSLWRFFQDKVLPKSAFKDDVVVFMEQGAWRYDLLGGGDMRVDDIVAVSPYNVTFFAWRGIPSEVIHTLNQTMNHIEGNKSTAFYPLLPQYILSLVQPPFLPPGAVYTLVTDAVEKIQGELVAIYPAANHTPPEPTNLTTMGMWLDYFQENRVGCKPSAESSYYQPGGWGSYGSGGSSSNKHPGGFQLTSQQVDGLWLGLAVAAVLVVIAVLVVYVRRSGIIWRRRRVERQEFETVDVLRAEREDEEEGEFI